MKRSKLFVCMMCITFVTGMMSGCAKENREVAVEEYKEELKNSKRSSLTAQEKSDHSTNDMEETIDHNTCEIIDYSKDDTPLDEYYYDYPRYEPNTEEYSQFNENHFMDVATNPLSTFSADVDTASYSNVRRMIYDRSYVNPDAVRIEEFINYFQYDYEKPVFDQPFTVGTEIMDCPWNPESKLLSIAVQTKPVDIDKLPDSNLVFLLDVSGSMSDEDKLPLMVNAFSLLVNELDKNDRISIVTYAGNDEILCEGVSGNNKSRIRHTLESLYASGGTNGSDGIITAYNLAERYFIQGGNNRVILATDGDLNIGLTSEDELKQLIEHKRDSGIYLSVLGFGTDNIKDNKMELLADYGNGNYSYIDSLYEAKKVLVDEMGGTLFTVAKDVKLQVEFNPAIVRQYRQIGYENRALQADDFEDDTKDAGELGAGHKVTALYEIILGKASDKPKSKLKYQKTELKHSKEWLNVNIRYKAPDSDKSRLYSHPVGDMDYTKQPSENIRFVACVAEFGMLLRGSAFSGNATYSGILKSLSSMNCVQEDEYKNEFEYLVECMANMYD